MKKRFAKPGPEKKSYFLMKGLRKVFEENPTVLPTDVAYELGCSPENIRRLTREQDDPKKRTETTDTETMEDIGKALGLTKARTAFLVHLKNLDLMENDFGEDSPVPLDMAYAWVNLSPDKKKVVREIIMDYAKDVALW
jgi:hypothetical protein